MNNLSVIEKTSSNLNIWDSSEDLKQIKEIYGRNLSPGEFNTLVQMGKATGLNPFLREIWAVKYGESAAQIFIGRDGYRKSAQRHPLYDYHMTDAVYSEDTFDVSNGQINHKYKLSNRGILIGAYCIVQRKGSSRPTYVFVELKEYTTGKSLWNATTGKPATMIKKVAEAQGLKSAFQELFAGTYSEYEEFTNDSTEANITRPGKGVNGLKEKLGMTKVKEKEEIFNSFDNETGEIIEPEIIYSEEENIDDSDSLIHGIRKLMEKAENIKELMAAMKMTKDFSLEEKKEISILFNKRQKELGTY